MNGLHPASFEQPNEMTQLLELATGVKYTDLGSLIKLNTPSYAVTASFSAARVHVLAPLPHRVLV